MPHDFNIESTAMDLLFYATATITAAALILVVAENIASITLILFFILSIVLISRYTFWAALFIFAASLALQVFLNKSSNEKPDFSTYLKNALGITFGSIFCSLILTNFASRIG
jgi:hypothetical protein